MNKLFGIWIVGLALLVSATSCDFDVAPELTEQAICEQDGGTWTTDGLRGLEMCFPKYEDAGKSCTAGDQCLGRCVTESRASETGQCAATIIFGCYSLLDDAGNAAMICVD